MASVQLGFVFDLYGDNTVGNDCLKTNHCGILVHWIHEQTWWSEGQRHRVLSPWTTRPAPKRGRSALGLPGLYLDLWTILIGPRGDIVDQGRDQADEGSSRQREETFVSNTQHLSPLDV